jgi:hypothetical protein
MGMLDSIFGGGDRSGAFKDYADTMGKNAERYNPWIDAGSRARDMNEAQYSRNINDPNAVQNQIASGFQYSPYQKFMLDNMTQRMNYNSANTGMLGTTQANQSLMDDLMKMTGQFQDTYIDRGMNSYNRGLQGNEFLQQQGMQGMGAQDNLYEQQAAARLKEKMAKEDANSSMWGNILGMAGAAAGAYFGGPMGAKMGSQMGQSMAGGSGSAGDSMGGYSPMPSGGWGTLT